MTTIEWIIICVAVAVCSALITWAITYSTLYALRRYKCNHRFEKVLYIDAPGVHKVAYLCQDCGKVKKVCL